VARPSWAGQAARIAWKDLHIEGRSREVLYTMGFMAALVVLVFSFAFISGQEATVGPDAIAGILWVAVLFSGTVALSRSFDRERESEAIRSLLLSPVPRSAIYAGKLAATAAIMFLVELLLTPLLAALFSAVFWPHALWLGLLLLLGTIGFASVGVIFSAALLRARSRDALLGALLFPIVIPVLLAASRATAYLLDPAAPDLDPALFWTRFLAALDVVFVVVGLWSFEPVVMGD
jgi:ABC-type transport system involved in cytochrome c biogenesis, permease component